MKFITHREKSPLNLDMVTTFRKSNENGIVFCFSGGTTTTWFFETLEERDFTYNQMVFSFCNEL